MRILNKQNVKLTSNNDDRHVSNLNLISSAISEDSAEPVHTHSPTRAQTVLDEEPNF